MVPLNFPRANRSERNLLAHQTTASLPSSWRCYPATRLKEGIRRAKPHASGVRNLPQVSALPVCEDEDAALRACSKGLVGELFRVGALLRFSREFVFGTFL